MKLDERLDDAFRALAAGVQDPPAIERVGSRRTRRRAIASLAVLAVLAVVGVFALRGGDAAAPRSIVANGGGDTTAANSQPVTVEYGGVQASVPTGWKVLRGAHCPGADRTFLVGPGKRGCDAPSTKRSWAWLAPSASRPATDRHGCEGQLLNDLPTCNSGGDGKPTVTFVGGTDVAVVTSPPVSDLGSPTQARVIYDSIALADPNADRSLGQDQQALVVAGTAADAYVRGDCAQLRSLAASPDRLKCPQRAPFVAADGDLPLGQEAELGGGSAGTRLAKVTYASTDAYKLRLRHDWSLSVRHGVWLVLGIDATDPATPLPQASAPGPTGCALVEDRSGHVVGCIHAEDVQMPYPERAALDARYGGLPVSANAKSKTVVGVVVNNLNYVPNRLVPRIADLQACTTAAKVHRFDPTQPAISDDCRNLLHDLGMTDTAIDVTG